MPINIAFYSDAMTTGRQYGLSRHAWELFLELRKLRPAIHTRPISSHVELEASDLQSMVDDYGYFPLPNGRRFNAARWSTLGKPTLERWAPWADIVHCVELDYRVATSKPLVVTIHDIGPLSHPHFFQASHPWLLKVALNNAVQKADRIICVSQATADAVTGYTKTSLGDRLAIIPEGVSQQFYQPVPVGALEQTAEFIHTEEPFFLCAGSLNPRKNLPNVIQAFEQVANEIPHHLILTGGLGWESSPILERIRTSAVRPRIHLPGRVSDAELRGLYQRAAAFIYASLMEGFGLPILEAMASNCPVITSDLSSMPEVAGDAAFLVDPESPTEIAQAMSCLASDTNFATLLRHRGRARAEDFRWDTAAASVARIYRQLGRPARGLNKAPAAPTSTFTHAA